MNPYFRTAVFLFLIANVTLAEDPPVSRLAGVSVQVADLRGTRQFYSGLLGLEEAFDLKDAGGAVRRVFFKVNDDQYLEFSLGAPAGFRLEHISLLSSDLKKSEAALRLRGIAPAKAEKTADGNACFTLKDPDGTEVDVIQYLPGSKQAQLRGKALGARRVSDHLQHFGVPADREAASMVFYRDDLGLREFLRGGSPPGKIDWIDLKIPGSPADFIELITKAGAPAREKEHIGFEVPDIHRAHSQLLEHGLKEGTKPFPAKMGRWLLFLRDPNGLRVELMGEAVAEPKGN